jgi:hypothetical protein
MGGPIRPEAQPNLLDVIAANTVMVMTNHPERRAEWFNIVRRSLVLAQQQGDLQLVILLDTISKLLLGDRSSSLKPPLEGEYAACWQAIVERIKKTNGRPT